jgi:pimeloyl-ACP methyl ester carboxylesterase
MAKTLRSIGLHEASVAFENGTVVEAPAFAGDVTQWRGGGSGLRSAMLPAERDLDPRFEDALAEVGIEVQETIHLDVKEFGSGMRGGRAAQQKADVVTIAPAPAASGLQVVLFQDESGGLSWHFPDGFLEKRAAKSSGLRSKAGYLRAPARARFTIPTRTAAARSSLAAAQPSTRLRGPVTKLGRKIFKVLVVPLSRLVAKPVEAIVGKVERKYRQELIRGVTATDFNKPVSTPFKNWRSLSGRRTLLIIHGIFSTTEGMLSSLAPSVMEQLAAMYEGRVIAFDQITASRGPEENAKNFLKTVANEARGSKLELDILCHSRGGIVARTLAERGAELVPAAACKVNKVFFVATPNQGSRLADPDHLVDMLDVFTNWSTNFSDGPVSYSLEVLLSIVKLLAYTVAAEVPGVAAMGTKGYIAKTLNAGRDRSPAIYAAAASNYQPSPARDNGFFTGRFANWIMDRVFEKVANDLVVPRDGVFAKNGHPSFPIEDPLVFAPSEAVWHTDFFGHAATTNKIVSFLAAGSPSTIRAKIPRTANVKTLEMVLEEAPAAATAGISVESSSSEPLGSRAGARSGSFGGADRFGYAGLGGLRSGGAGGGERRIVKRETLAARRLSSRATKAAAGSRGLKRAKVAASARRRSTEREIVSRPLAEESAPLERRPEIIFHEEVTEGEVNELIVRLADIVSKGALGNLLIEIGREQSAEITVTLHAPGFVVTPKQPQKMIVSRNSAVEKQEVVFGLKAKNLGPKPVRREISAEFWHGNGLIGSVTHYANVVPKGYSGLRRRGRAPKIDAFVLAPVKREDCDLIIMIGGENESGVAPFRLKLSSTIPDEAYNSLDCGRINLPPGDLGSYINSATGQLIANYPDTRGMSRAEALRTIEAWNKQFVIRLRELGRQLWNYLPQSFRDEYFRLYQTGRAPQSILVHSDEMVFPWELVIPNETINKKFVELDPLGVLHILGRWRPGMKLRPSPQRMPGKAFVLLRPAYSGTDALPWAEKEAKQIAKLLTGIEIIRPVDSAAIQNRLIKRSDVKVLHYSGHGEFDPGNADLSSLLLEDSTTVTALTLANTKLGNEGQPILYLNACAVGATAITVGRPGGFASACLQGGYSGVIAPYWPINDASAARFSVALYERLIRGRSIGEALRELRDENQNDPTFLAFAYFGDPWTRVDFSRLMTSSKPKRLGGSKAAGRSSKRRQASAGSGERA